MAPMGTEAKAVVLGDLVLDLVAILPGPLNYGTDTRCQLFPRPGGAAANTATWLRRLGLPVLYVGRVGADPLGQALVDGLRQEGVDARVARDPEAPTGTIVALISPGGERSMLISPGANHRLRPEDLPADVLAGAGVLHLTGYSFFWDAPRQAARAALAAARAQGIPVAVDVASAGLIREYGAERLLADLAGVTYLFCNEDEARLLTGAADPEIALEMLARSFPVVGLKCGPRGSLVAAGSERVVQPALPAPAVDTTGCGDAWDAGLLAGLLQGLSLRAAARLAAWTAAWVVARPGAVPAGWADRDRAAAWTAAGAG